VLLFRKPDAGQLAAGESTYGYDVTPAASLDLAQRWMDRGAGVRTYRFTASTNLPHNVMELTMYGGNTNVVYPVVEALARGQSVAQQDTVRLLGVPCAGFRCRLRRLARMP
jgi:hypothetical protein